jgi:hypothetical protein
VVFSEKCPQIGHVRLAALVEQDVGRLEVTVEDTPLVRVVHRLGGLLQQACRGSRVGGVTS